ncbi:MAG: hypothetical protein Q8S00_32385 [Deltaproteobacteria bacterium]|nr:hypothetical protein [Deltaproteobacteria bacterium]
MKYKIPEERGIRLRANPPYLFHVTSYHHLANIAEHGLHYEKRQGRSIGTAAYDFNRKDSIFLTEADGIGYWAERLEAFIEHNVEDPKYPMGYEDEEDMPMFPVVLRISGLKEDELHIDDVGTRDALANAYKTSVRIETIDIELWDGEDWVPIEDYDELIDTDAPFESDSDTDDGEEVEYNFLKSEQPYIEGAEENADAEGIE